RAITPPGALDVYLTICKYRIIAPGKQTEHSVQIDVVHIGREFETITPISKSPPAHDLRALPLIRTVCNPHVKLALPVHPNIIGAVREIVWAGSHGTRAGLHPPIISAKAQPPNSR